MTQSCLYREYIELPGNIAEALIAGIDCEAVIEHREKWGEADISVPRVEAAEDVGNEGHITLYRVSDSYVIAEGIGEYVPVYLTIEAEYLPTYLEAACTGPRRTVYRADADVWWLDAFQRQSFVVTP